MLWGIAPEDSYANLVEFQTQMGLTFPVLFDEGSTVNDFYTPGAVPTDSKYPQDWIIGVDGRVKYVNTLYDPVEIRAVLDAELASNGR